LGLIKGRAEQKEVGGPKISEETSRAKQSINTEKQNTQREGEKGRKESEINPAIIFIPAQEKSTQNRAKNRKKTEKDRACESKRKKKKQTEREGTDTDEKGKAEEIT